jgi:hypothetical protein
MASYTPSLGLELITPGSQAGLWGNTTNNSLNLVDQAITGVTPLSFASASGSVYTLTDFNGAQDESRSAVLNITGTAAGSNTVVIPNKQKTYLVRNFTGQDVIFRTPTPSATYTVGAGYSILIFCDGNNNVFTGIAAPSVGTLLVNAGGTGSTTFTAGFVKSPGGTSALTSAATVSLSSEVSGTLPVSNGGTGVINLANNGIMIGKGSGAVESLLGGASGQVATWNGSAWTAATPAAGAVTSVSSTTIGVSPTVGNVIITLSSSNITTALGYTPYNGTTNPNGYISSSSGTAFDSSRLGGTLASGYVTTAGVQTISGAKTYTAAQTVSGLGFGGQGFIVTSSGQTGALSNNSVQVGYTGVGMYAASSTSFGFFTGSAGINLVGSNMTFSPGNATALTGSWINGSDIRIKENIEPLQDGLSVISALSPVMFSYKKDELDSPNKYGLIAQEVETVLPNLISIAEDERNNIQDLHCVDYVSLVPILIKAVQELKAEIDTLKAAK